MASVGGLTVLADYNWSSYSRLLDIGGGPGTVHWAGQVSFPKKIIIPFQSRMQLLLRLSNTHQGHPLELPVMAFAI